MATVDVGIIFTAINRARGGIASVRRDIDDVGNSAGRAEGRLRAIHAVLLGIGTGAAASAAKAILNVASSMEAARIRVATFTGGLQEADKAIAILQKNIAGTSVATETAMGAFARFSASGIQGVNDKLATLTDTVAAFGGSTAEFERASTAIAQMAGKGIISMEELRQQLGEAVPVAISLFAKVANKSVSAFVDEVSKGKVVAGPAIEGFFREAEKVFGGFSEAMRNTLQGAFSNVAQAWQALGQKMAETGLTTRLAIAFNTVTDQVRAFIDSLTKEDMNRVWDWMMNGVQFAAKVGDAISRIAQAIGALFSFVAGLLGQDGGVALTIGLIGRLFFGRVGMVGALVVGAAGDQIAGFIQMATEAWNRINGILQGAGGTALQFGILGYLILGPLGGAVVGVIAGIYDYVEKRSAQLVAQAQAASGAMPAVPDDSAGFGSDGALVKKGMFQNIVDQINGAATPQAADDANKAIDDTTKKIKGMMDEVRAATSSEGVPKLDKTFEKLESKGRALNDRVDEIDKSLRRMRVSAAGDEKAAALLDIEERFRAINDSIAEQSKLAGELAAKYAPARAELERLNALSAEAARLQEELIAKTEAQFAAKQKVMRLQTDAQIADMADTIKQLGQEVAPGLLQSEFVTKALEMQDRFAATVRQNSAEIAQLQEDMIGKTAAEQEQIQRVIDGLSLYNVKLTEAQQRVTAVGLLTQQAWAAVSETIQTGVADSLQAIIMRSGNLEDIMMSVWNNLTSAAINYLLELGKIYAMQQLMAAAGGGTGGGASGLIGTFLGGFAKGGVMPGTTTMGQGVVSGPTLFGVAGEAGKEAVLPLTSVGGKLGVRATGAGGGQTINLSIHAIDTQTGAQFLLENLDTIADGLSMRGRLNAGGAA